MPAERPPPPSPFSSASSRPQVGRHSWPALLASLPATWVVSRGYCSRKNCMPIPIPVPVPDWDEISPSPTGMKSPRPRPRSRTKKYSHTRLRAATSTRSVNYKRKGDQTIGEESSALTWRRGSRRAVRGRATPTCLTEAAQAAAVELPGI
jgi:hypothetical protein